MKRFPTIPRIQGRSSSRQDVVEDRSVRTMLAPLLRGARVFRCCAAVLLVAGAILLRNPPEMLTAHELKNELGADSADYPLFQGLSSSPTTTTNETILLLASEEEAPGGCFKPRSFDIAKYLKENQLSTLPKPWIHIGMPKTGTTTLEHFWTCGLNRKDTFDDFVSHSVCKVSSEELRNQAFSGTGIPSNPLKQCPSNRIKPCKLCGTCMSKAKEFSLPLLESCGNYSAWAQLDTAQQCYYPQLSALDLIHQESPRATFVFMFRDVDRWINSVQHFRKGTMLKGLSRCDLPYWKGKGNLKEWFCDVVNRARQFVAANPGHAYLEIDLEDPASSQLASTAFGISESCWGMHNINQNIHGNNLTATANRK